MGSPITTIQITHDKQAAIDLKNRYQTTQATQPRLAAVAIENLMSELALGVKGGTLLHTIDDGDGVAASGTITFSSLANNDTITVCGVVFTAKTSGASGVAQFNLGADDTAAAVAAVVKINAHTTLTYMVTATSALGVITLTCVRKGRIGNFLTTAISAHGSVSGSGLLTSGTDSGNSVTKTHKFGVS